MMSKIDKKIIGLCITVLILGWRTQDSITVADTTFIWHPASSPLMTRWAKDVSASNPLPDYPRPQMTRPTWQSLNGVWQYALADPTSIDPPAHFDGNILVPYPYESALSGVGKPSPVGNRLWYQRSFNVPSAWTNDDGHVLLHLGAVNWDSTVLINGKPVGGHKGGFDGFDFDVTTAVRAGSNLINISAWNPMQVATADAQVVGKQRLHPGGIFYTGSTGIWQPVWLEPVPAVHIASLKLMPEIDHDLLRVTVACTGAADSVQATASDGNAVVADTKGNAGVEMILPLKNVHLWTPGDPHLYSLHVALVQKGNISDSVDSYFAMRKISLGKDDRGRTRMFLNNKFLFEVGALDQGYWPDGIYTAPTDDALKSDITAAKDLGLNLLRKHAKVEPDRWYYWADRVGILVWQDMPQCFGTKNADPNQTVNVAAKAQWLSEWKQILAQRQNHPSIIVWTTFNEGWGQHDTEDIALLTKQLDPARLVNSASGWTDKGAGDVRDTHAYPGPWCEKPEPDRAVVNGEFGGVTMRVPGHMWTTRVYGYGATLDSSLKVTQNIQKLLKNAYALRDDRACSAVVYTQLTDVEGESNGLLTYDRAVVKPDAATVAAANQGKFLPFPPPSTAPAQEIHNGDGTAK